MPAACRLDLLLQDRLDQLGSADVLLQRKLVQALQQLGSTFNSTRFSPFSRSRLSWLRLLILSWVSRGVDWSLACRGASQLRTDPVLFDQFAVWPYITDENS
jgi:hypothetical protein